MRFLLVGDFHGKFPSKLKNKIKKEKFDYILCTGDLANLDKIRKYIFKYWTTQVWWQAIGIKKARKIEKESFDSGLRILKELGGELFGVWLQDGSQVNLYFSTLINRVEELMEDIADRKKDTGGDASDLSVPLEKKQWDWSGFRLYEFDKTAQRLFEKEIKEIEKPGKKN